jgi:hypothetical protein
MRETLALPHPFFRQTLTLGIYFTMAFVVCNLLFLLKIFNEWISQ